MDKVREREREKRHMTERNNQVTLEKLSRQISELQEQIEQLNKK